MANGIRLTMTLGTNTTDRTVEVHGTITSRLQGSEFMSSCLEAIASVRPLGACNSFVRVASMAMLSMSSARIFAALSYA